MDNILITDICGISHIGNVALFQNSYRILKQLYPRATIRGLAYNPDQLERIVDISISKLLARDFPLGKSYALKLIWFIRSLSWFIIHTFNLGVLDKLSLRAPYRIYTWNSDLLRSVNYYNDAELIVSISGEGIASESGYSVILTLFPYIIAKLQKKKVVIFPQSFGPFKRNFLYVIFKLVLSKLDLLMVRDKISLDSLRSLLSNCDKILFCPDVVISQDISEKNIEIDQNHLKVIETDESRKIGFCISSFRGSHTYYYDIVRDTIIRLLEDERNKALLFVANMPFGDADKRDYELSAKLINEIDHSRLTLITKYYPSAYEFQAWLSYLNVLVSTRMHAAILATNIFTPTITINSQEKLFGYMSLCGQQDLSINMEALSTELLLEKIMLCVNDEQSVRKQLEEKHSHLTNIIFNKMREAKSLLDA
ncbi:polysaccharide pyruvyl transferase family protein [Candidatus Omnitrophota bacterium]